MAPEFHHPNEADSNACRDQATAYEPRALRTYTSSLAVLARSAGIFHWTPEGRRLFDFTSGVLVANLRHNPASWMQRFTCYMGWSDFPWKAPLPSTPPLPSNGQAPGYFSALTMTAYN